MVAENGNGIVNHSKIGAISYFINHHYTNDVGDKTIFHWIGGMDIKKILTLKILSFLCVALLFVNSLNAFIQPAQSSSEDSNNLHIISGTGTFSSISENHTITVFPGQKIKGYVTLAAHNKYPSDWVVPLIGMPSWGDKAGNWWLIDNWLPTGDSTQETSVNITAPQEPGVYHMIFAFSCELSGDQVASATDWHNGHVVWNDGNDLADLNSTQIAQAQQNGAITITWLGESGEYGPADTAADAIEIIVSENSTLPQSSADGQQPIATQTDTNLMLMIAIVILSVLVLLIVGSLLVVLLVSRKPHNGPDTESASQKAEVPSKTVNEDIADKLSTLQALRARGLITDRDYEDKKKEILGKF